MERERKIRIAKVSKRRSWGEAGEEKKKPELEVAKSCDRF